MARLTTAAGGPRIAEPTEDAAQEPQATTVDDRDAEIEALRAQLAAKEQEVVALQSAPSRVDGRAKVRDGHERVVPQGDFDLNYGGRKYVFKGGVPVEIPQEVANHLKSVKLQDSQTGYPIQFDGNSLFRSTNA